MFSWVLGTILSFSPPAASAADAAPDPNDPYGWLEDVLAPRSMEWVKARNAESTKTLEGKGYQKLHDRLKSILDSSSRIPYVAKMGTFYYNFWQDADHERGIWRRTTLEEYKKAAPAWDTVIDLDALDRAEGVNWVWHGADCLEPAYERCLVALSRGGSDADVRREYDLANRTWVSGGFAVPEAKSEVGWITKDRLWVMTDVGEGSLTSSGYPREARAWDRGTPLADAPVLFSGTVTDVSVSAYTDHDDGYVRHFVSQGRTFFTNRTLVERDGLFTPIAVPEDAQPYVHREWLYVQLRSDWTVGGKTWKSGCLLVAPFEAFMKGDRSFEALFTPSATTALASYVVTPSAVTLNVLDNVRSKVLVVRHGASGWTSAPLAGLPEFGSVGVTPVDAEHSDELWLTVTDFLTPTRLSLASVAPGAGPPQNLKSMPSMFKADGLEISQHEAISKDGTKIPYFEVAKKGLKATGTNPTLLYGYGGFEVSMLPTYNAGMGAGWLERGGVYVLANIRGGGEFGPEWHTSARRENRHRAYEDFAAVARDLTARKVTSPEHLGAMGGSNGGLLMGNMIVQYPELFGAIVCQVPLLDMKRYSHLLAGASWMDEYGDPDVPTDWEFLKTFSPYQLESKAKASPPVLFLTSTRDDRVHPGHARKMAAKMLDNGKQVLLWEDIEGGHGGAATSDQKATMWALSWSFLWKELL